jgi:hypothetical protein
VPESWTIDDLIRTMALLAERRPVFHSEADFQHAFAWQLHLDHPDARIRLETRIRLRERLDVFVTLRGRRIAVELKYLVRKLSARVDGELFALPDQAAQDIGRHAFIKDISRLERMRLEELADDAYAVVLTNDPGYWRPSGRETIDAAFRLHEGRRLTGALAWAAHAGAWTTKERLEPIDLSGEYLTAWRDYSQIGDVPYGHFRYLVAEVLPGAI